MKYCGINLQSVRQLALVVFLILTAWNCESVFATIDPNNYTLSFSMQNQELADNQQTNRVSRIMTSGAEPRDESELEDTMNEPLGVSEEKEYTSSVDNNDTTISDILAVTAAAAAAAGGSYVLARKAHKENDESED